MSYLFTKDDIYNIHKILGFICILNYIYRYFYCLLFFNNLQYHDLNIINIFTILSHLFLSVSSIKFKIPEKRILNKPLIIYKEYRLHAIIFTFRSISVYLLALFNLQYLCAIIVLFIHILADIITIKYGTIGLTSVRFNNIYKNNTDLFARRSYSYYQFLAISSHIFYNKYKHDLGFNTLIAIQSSAFLMTLLKKNKIKWYIHSLLYILCLVLSSIVIYLSYGINIFLITIPIFTLRILGINKYLLWITFYIISNNYYY